MMFMGGAKLDNEPVRAEIAFDFQRRDALELAPITSFGRMSVRHARGEYRCMQVNG